MECEIFNHQIKGYSCNPLIIVRKVVLRGNLVFGHMMIMRIKERMLSSP